MRDYRCPKCDRLLFKAYISAAHIEVKCKCGALAIIDVPDGVRAFAALDWHGGERGKTNPESKWGELYEYAHQACNGITRDVCTALATLPGACVYCGKETRLYRPKEKTERGKTPGDRAISLTTSEG